MDVVTNTICAGEALFAYLNLNQRLIGKLRTIRHIDRPHFCRFIVENSLEQIGS